MKRIRIAVLMTVLTAMVCHGEIRISGSDLLGEGVREAFLSELESAGLEADFSFKGSLLARSALAEGRADVALVASPEGSDEPFARSYVVAFQVVAFAVHSSNPLMEVSYLQLANAFQEGGGIDNWVNLTDEPAWQDRKIDLWAARSDKSITLQIFNAVVLKGSPLKGSVRYLPTEVDQLQRTVEEEPSSLVIAPPVSLGQDVRLLAIKQDESAQAYTPSQDNVFYGDYPLRLPFKLVLADSLDATTARILVEAVYSDTVKAALEAAYYMTPPQAEREAVLAQLD